MKKFKKNAFSLVELAMVLIIISVLLVGVISARGQIKKASFNAVMNEFITYREMIELFRTQYDYYPGDFPRAHNIWGSQCSASADDCNGDGNGIIDYVNNSKNAVEAFRAWQHMFLAGISLEDLPGTANINGEADFELNVPKSDSVDAGWTFDLGTYVDNDNENIGTQVIRLGGFMTGRNLVGSFMSASDANIFNRKFDNGVANTGGIMHYCYDIFELDRCYTGVVEYDIADSTLNCFLEFVIRNNVPLDDSPC